MSLKSLNKSLDNLNLIAIDNFNYKPIAYSKIKCPKCNVGTIFKEPGYWVGKCKVCPSTYFSFWKPTPSQKVIQDLLATKRTKPLWLYNIGAMNTGKTDVDMATAVDFAMQNPGTKQCILANDFQMIKRVIPESLDPFIHPDWYARSNGKEKKSIDKGYYFENGSSIIFMPSDDENKIKSLNLSRFILIEGEKINIGLVHALSARLRQDAGVIYETDEKGNYITEQVDVKGKIKIRKKIKQSYFAIIVEANPDASSYVFSEGLLESSAIYHTQSVQGFSTYNNLKTKNSEFKKTVITATPDNPYIKEGFIEEKIDTWTADERRQNLYGEFVAGDSLVYPEFFDNVVEPYSVDKQWPAWISLDMGVGKDPTAILIKSYDPFEKKYVYHTEKRYDKTNLRVIGDYLINICKNWNVQDITIDPSANQTRQLTNLTSTAKELSDIIGRPLIPAKNAIEDGIRLVNDRINTKKILFMSNLEETISEVKKYRYNIKQGEVDRKPIDKFNHFMDSLRYNEQLTRGDDIHGIIDAYEKQIENESFVPKPKKTKLPWAFQEQVVLQETNIGGIDYMDFEDEDYGE